VYVSICQQVIKHESYIYLNVSVDLKSRQRVIYIARSFAAEERDRTGEYIYQEEEEEKEEEEAKVEQQVAIRSCHTYSVGVSDGAEDLQLLLKSSRLLALPRHHLLLSESESMSLSLSFSLTPQTKPQATAYCVTGCPMEDWEV
jgi:hypothetical protein